MAKRPPKSRRKQELGLSGMVIAAASIVLVSAFLFQSGPKYGNHSPEPACDCPFEWDPVCGIVGRPGQEQMYPFPNKCEAKCKRIDTLTAGLCEGTRRSFKCVYENQCSNSQGQSVCWHGHTLPNRCWGKCVIEIDLGQRFDPDELEDGKCEDPCAFDPCESERKCVPKPGKCFEEPCQKYRCVATECNCDHTPSPVCHKGITFTNECQANCQGAFNPTPGKCKKLDPFYFFDQAFPYAMPIDTNAHRTKKSKKRKKRKKKKQS